MELLALDGEYEAWTVVVNDRAGGEVFRNRDPDTSYYSQRVRWESNQDRDRLWILPPADKGTYFVTTDDAGRWAKTRYLDGIHDLIAPAVDRLRTVLPEALRSWR